ncbi:retrovirus-related pol polyprotein from transposon TNT 1-94 [Tanacetum coccineum]|uniref:Retrovirus-related pol polyprotein from transposon TNT 1-94 n=1 Tax=Tanacetum coccineum TaxID=301880 RepID=A0ABQ5EP20_9ASTR
MLYDGNDIVKETSVISIADSEETLMLDEENFGKRFVPQQELFDERAFHPNTNQSASSLDLVKIEAPRELPMLSLVNTSLKKLKYHLVQFDTMMEADVQQYFVDKQCFEIQKKQFLIENDQLLDQIISQDIVNIVVNSSLDINTSVNLNFSVAMNDSINYVEIFSELEQHCISLELAMQLNKEIFQKNNTSVNQTETSFDQLFELNYLKADLQKKDTTIKKLKANIKRLNKTSTTNSVKKDIDEIETINIKLEHRVAKLIYENEHLKQTYKQLYDSIKPSRVLAKEHIESLVNQLNQKSVEITDLNAQLQEKVFVIATLKNDLRKLKGKDMVDNAVQVSNATTIALGMYKIDLVTLASKDKNNREAHIYYLKHIIEQAAILKEIVEQAKSLNPLDSSSYSAYKYVKLIQELLGYVRDTCPDIHKPSDKLVVVMPINKKNIVRSKSIDNTKNDRILQILSSTQKKNKVEDHSRIVNSMFDARHELCFLEFVSDMNACSKSKSVKKAKKKEEWKPTGKVITATNEVPLREPIPLEVVAQEYVVTKVYTRRPKVPKTIGSNSKPKIANSMISNKTKPGTSQGSNTSVAPSSSSLVDLRLSKLFCGIWTPDVQSILLEIALSLPISFTSFLVYYVEGLGRNLFYVGQLCDSDLEVAFRKHTCFVRNLEGVDLLSGSRETNLYTLSIGDMMASSTICLLSKSSKTKSWPMRVASINGKKYILVIVDDYSRFTWVKFLASKDEAPDFIIKFNDTSRIECNCQEHSRNLTLVEVARTMLIYAKAPLFLYAEVVATTCYTQNRSIKRLRHGKTPYELLHDRKPNLSYLHVFGALCYPNNDSKNLDKLQAKADIVANAPRAIDLADSPVSTSIDQDDPSTSILIGDFHTVYIYNI